MRIQHNIPAMSAYRNYNNNTSALAKNLEKLSSGYKINRAGDDAAGLAISEKMRAQITGLNAASKNVKDGISLVKTAEGAMQEVQDMLNRMDYLATQSANGTYDNEVDRLNLQKEVDALKTEINRIADSANFNGIKLLDGTQADGVSIRGAKSVDVSMLPDVTPGKPGSGTILNREAAAGSTGTTFSVDLHNFSLSNGSAAGEYTLTAGDVVITFQGNATAGAASTVTADKLIDDLIKGGGSNFTVTGVTVGGEIVASGISSKGVISTAKYGDINLTKGNGGDNRLTFTQAKRPTQDSEVWDVAKSVSITSAPAAGGNSLQTLSASPLVENQPVYTVTPAASINNISIVAGSASTAGASQAVTAAVTLDSSLSTNLMALASSAVGNVTLTATASGVWSLSVGASKSIALTATVSSAGTTVTLTAGSGSTAVNIGSIKLTVGASVAASKASSGALQTALRTAFSSGVQVATASLVTPPDKPVMGSDVTKASQAIEVLASAGYTAKGSGITLEAEVPAVAGITWTASAATVVSASKAAALGNAVSDITIGQGANAIVVTGSAIKAAIGSSATTMGDIRSKILKALEDKAVQSVKDQYAASASTITVYSNFRFVNGSGTVVHAADPNAHIEYDVTQYTNQPVPPTNGGGDNSAGQDYNFTTTAIEKVDTDAGDRLAGTWLTTDQVSKYVADGKGLKIGKEQYIFTTNMDMKVPQGTKLVDISDLVDDKGNVTDLKTALERLTKVAENNSTYTVGFDGTRVGFEEKQNQGDFVDEDGKSTLNTKENIAKSLGFIEGSVTGNGGLTLQIGDTSDSYNQLQVTIGDMHTTGMGIDGVDISTQAGAQAAIDQIRDAINYVSGIRGDLGAVQNRLEHTSNNLSVMAENIQDAESTIRDTDVAEEMMSYVKNNILVQSAQAMLAQANQLPQGVLQLLG